VYLVIFAEKPVAALVTNIK